ncbi:hypothetical protein GS399_08040 [Pedobacter sp. HMF7647]|uniref:Outer membrane beta-barrel protein n=1 Tax=Hufsiella arboris TaxID=2695275 RepID=A0A7K1Y8K3_9SPHI|nr:porin family protein [Hufsiella arboris]MXV50922.1 hypothetical protein [Hufsiella arboris]
MKKLLFTLIIAAAAINGAQAQLQQGNVMVGADLSNIKFDLDAPNTFNFNISPKAAWFIQNGTALGGEVDFGLATSKGAGTFITYGVSALGRKYVGNGADVLIKNSRIFGEATVGIQGTNNSESGENTNGLGFSFGPGYTYFITPTIGLEALLKYNGIVGFGSSAYAHNLNFGLGFQIYLPGARTAQKVKSDATQ